jgi:hypothetical protein
MIRPVLHALLVSILLSSSEARRSAPVRAPDIRTIVLYVRCIDRHARECDPRCVAD